MYEKLKDYLSEERLKTYLDFTNNDKEKAIELYDWNIILCESLYSLLSYFEVILRNICNNKLIEKFSENWYLNIKLLQGNNPEKGEWAINKINETIKKYEKEKERKI